VADVLARIGEAAQGRAFRAIVAVRGQIRQVFQERGSVFGATQEFLDRQQGGFIVGFVAAHGRIVPCASGEVHPVYVQLPEITQRIRTVRSRNERRILCGGVGSRSGLVAGARRAVPRD